MMPGMMGGMTTMRPFFLQTSGDNGPLAFFQGRRQLRSATQRTEQQTDEGCQTACTMHCAKEAGPVIAMPMAPWSNNGGAMIQAPPPSFENMQMAGNGGYAIVAPMPM